MPKRKRTILNGCDMSRSPSRMEVAHKGLDIPIACTLGKVVATAQAQFVGLSCQSLQPAKTPPRSGTFVSTAPAASDPPAAAKLLASRRATFLVGNNSIEVELDARQLADLAEDPNLVGEYEVSIVRRVPLKSVTASVRGGEAT